MYECRMGKAMTVVFVTYFLRQTQQQQRCENFADYLRRKKMAAAQLRVNLRELHAQTQTASDCRAWMRRNGLLAVNMT